MDCYSCLSLSGKRPLLPGSTIYKGKFWVVEHVSSSSRLGWMVIVLKRHEEELHDVTTEEYKELIFLQEKTVHALKKLTNCKKEYIACFSEGEHFNHIHFHVIPVPENQPTSFKGPKVFQLLKGSPLPKEEILEFCGKLREEFKT